MKTKKKTRVKKKQKKTWRKLDSKNRTPIKMILTKIHWNYKAKYNLLDNEIIRQNITYLTMKLQVSNRDGTSLLQRVNRRSMTLISPLEQGSFES